MMDWSSLVLGPCQDAFGQPATFSPTASQPGAPDYQGRGVFEFKAVQIPLEDGTYISTNQPQFGIRLSEYPILPLQNDSITLSTGKYQIVDVVPDGQGKADLILRRTDGPEASE